MLAVDNFDHARHQIGYADFKFNAVAALPDSIWLATNHGLYRMHRNSETPSSWQRYAIGRQWDAVDVPISNVVVDGKTLIVTRGVGAEAISSRYNLTKNEWE